MPALEKFQIEQICVGLIRAPTAHVQGALRAQLKKILRYEICFTQSEIDWKRFFSEQGQLYNVMKVEVALFPIDSNLTAYVCNLADGWESLYEMLMQAERYDAFFFRNTMEGIFDHRVHEMRVWESGYLIRHLRSLQDDIGWSFLNDGTPLSFEDTSYYRKRRISDRVNARLINSYSTHVGYTITDALSFRGVCYHFARSDQAAQGEHR